eukprot:COSAG02_NODE_8813_length_2435_cov_1.633134_2_plen_69_part_00
MAAATMSEDDDPFSNLEALLGGGDGDDDTGGSGSEPESEPEVELSDEDEGTCANTPVRVVPRVLINAL